MVTLLDLKTRSRERADMVNSNFIEDTELVGYINSSIAELHDLLIGAYDNDYNIAKYSFTTASGVDSYDLPEAFYKMRGVDAKIVGQQWYSMKPFNFNERNRNQDLAWGLLAGPTIRYRLLGNQIVFNPAPDSTYDIRLWHIPTAQKLVANTDVYNDINSYAEYVVTDVAIKMLQKEESDVSVLSAQKMDLRKRIENMSQNRDAGNPDSVSDIYAENNEFWLTRSN